MEAEYVFSILPTWQACPVAVTTLLLHSPSDPTQSHRIRSAATEDGDSSSSPPPYCLPLFCGPLSGGTGMATTSMDESAVLDVLFSDFSGPPVAAPAAAVVPPSSHPHAPPAKAPLTHSAAVASGPVLDELETTLLPHFPKTKPKDGTNLQLKRANLLMLPPRYISLQHIELQIKGVAHTNVYNL
ncbi:hypothetical protein SRHO_G00226770 [Serrasalmus rhombeus]